MSPGVCDVVVVVILTVCVFLLLIFRDVLIDFWCILYLSGRSVSQKHNLQLPLLNLLLRVRHHSTLLQHTHDNNTIIIRDRELSAAVNLITVKPPPSSLSANQHTRSSHTSLTEQLYTRQMSVCAVNL